MTRAIHLSHDVVVPVPRDQVWEWVADTDAMNQAAGMSAVDVELLDAKRGNTTTRVRETQGFLLAMTWEEGPYEFVRPEGYRIARKVISGPLTGIVSKASLEEMPDGGTRVTFALELTPRFALLAPAVRAGGTKQLRQRAARLAEMAAKWKASPTHDVAFPIPPAPLAPGGEQLLAERMPRVRRAVPELAGRLEEYLRLAPDYLLLRMRPFELADRWGAPRMLVLKALLHAAHAELVNISWDILCPHCRVPTARSGKLGELTAEGSCDACDLTYATDFDAAVEVTFQVHPSIRHVEQVKFCLGSPAKRKGVFFQQVLGPREKRDVSIQLPAGDYVLMRADSENRLHVQVGDGGDRFLALVHEDGVTRGELSLPGVRKTGPASFTLENGLDTPVRVGLAMSAVTPDAASASMVTTFQDFRELFSSQVLSPGVQLSRASVTLLFTDLKGSTSLYQTHGDNRMYARVRDHFEVLTEAVRVEGGGVVKTIGDAVMASFPTPAAGVRAALAMQRAIAQLNARQGTPELTVKVGLHSGPCLVVNANDRLDYFGNTVNQAARIEGQSKGGDVVVTDTVAQDPEVAALLPGDGLVVSRFETQLKGLTGDFVLTRIEIAGATARATAAG